MKHNGLHYYLYDHRARRFHEIRDGTVCGRMEGDIKFPGDDLMSRAHCRFAISGNNLYIEDLRSTNHTSVNTVPIRSSVKRRIQLNDVIEFGLQRFTLTHQCKFAPGNEEDFGTKKIYRARPTEDGGLSSQVSKVFTKQTMVLLDKYNFHILRMKELLVPSALSRRNRSRAVVAGERRSRKRSVKWIAAVLVLSLMGVAIAKSGLLNHDFQRVPAYFHRSVQK